MSSWESIFAWTAFGGYLVAFILALAGLRGSREKFILAGLWVSCLAWLSQTCFIGLRWLQAGHPPISGTFENTQVASWVIMLTINLISINRKKLNFLVVFGSAWAIAIFLFGLNFSRGTLPLIATLKGPWVQLHALFAWVAFAGLVVTWCIALKLVFLLNRIQKSNLDYLYDVFFKGLIYSFVVLTGMVAVGCFSEFLMYGEFWQWDLVEILTLISFLMYGLAIHIWLFYPENRKWTIWLALVALLPVLVAGFGIPLLSETSFHIFDI